MASLDVTKMHGLGNNYIFVDGFVASLDEEELPALARAVSDIRRGIGSDGLILIEPSRVATARMRIFNADGSEAENCGNGLRCVAKYVYEHGYVESKRFDLETATQTVHAQVWPSSEGLVDRVTIDMGPAQFGPAAVGYHGGVEDDSSSTEIVVPTSQGPLTGTAVSMGNPHFVVFTGDVADAPLTTIGPEVETAPCFPNRINVEWVAPKSRTELDFRVWERGSGVTFACGTGACAAVAAGIARGMLDHQVIVHLQGGDLEVRLEDGRLWMTGEAVEVFRGQFQWPVQAV